MDAPLATAWRPPFDAGDPAPWFEGATPNSAHFHFSTTVGRYLLLGFLPPPGAARDAAFAAFEAHRGLFDDHKLSAFLVLPDPVSIAKARNQPPGLRWFLDSDGAISRLYGALDGDGVRRPFWLLLDPSHRVLGAYALADAAALFAQIVALPPIADFAGAELYAPVLIAPRILKPETCRRLIALYEAQGRAPSGVMRDVDGRTVGVLDDFKRRRDVAIGDAEFRRSLRVHLAQRLIPEIAKVFQYQATRIERYIVACYDAEESGYFKPHRDNETLITRHRKFAVSINLNAEDFEGGDLRFPEFGRRTYRPPTGGAVVFSCSLQHEATPVTRGRRYAFLPFLYDEAGAAIRDTNAGAAAS